MEILKLVEEIIKKHDLKKIELPAGFSNVYLYLAAFPEERKKFSNIKNDSYFIKKYHKYIPDGWYGFSIGEPIIPEWCDIIDDVLELCIENDPEFEIHQIKLKFGGIRFYVSSGIIEDIYDVESVLDGNLYDEALIW